MKKRFDISIVVVFFISIWIFNSQVLSAENLCYSKMSEVLDCFIKHDDGNYRYEFLTENNSNPQITIKSYILTSQKWPINNSFSIPSSLWRHKLNFYIPKKVSYSQAFLYVAGGYNRDKKGKNGFFSSKQHLNYENIAINNKVVVIELEDVPNQFLWIKGGLKREDQILAYTYKEVMADPMRNAYLAGHLPMAKAVVKAMDASQKILKKEYGLDVTGFILGGASKRGWTIWLACLSDKRVEAIIPIVDDILNSQKSIEHICSFYENGCPKALQDYEKEGLISKINTLQVADLMKIEDPFSYLGDEYKSKYRERLAVPKYIINASGDDFFVPDSSRWYFKGLPGDANYLRYLPNSMHYFMGNSISNATNSFRLVSESINSYLYFILNKIELPKLQWKFENNRCKLASSLKPETITLWVANNKHKRDFRFITDYSWFRLFGKRIKYMYSGDFLSFADNHYKQQKISFNCQKNHNCNVMIPLPKNSGWQASFVEVYYKINNVDFAVTTEVDISKN